MLVVMWTRGEAGISKGKASAMRTEEVDSVEEYSRACLMQVGRGEHYRVILRV